MFSSDSRHMLVASDRTGSWQLYDLDLEESQLQLLTDDLAVDWAGATRAAGRPYMFYVSDDKVRQLNTETGKRQTVFVPPEGFSPGPLSVSSDGWSLAFACSEDLWPAIANASDRALAKEHVFRKPRSIIVLVNLATWTSEVVWGETEWIKHVYISPVDSRRIVFNREGPGDLVYRAWTMDATHSRVSPLVEQELHHERVGPAFFLADGRVAAQVGRRDRLDQDWTDYVTVLEPDGSTRRDYQWPGAGAAHIQASPDCKLWVGDIADVSIVGRPGDTLCLFTLGRGAVRPTPLCQHASTWRRRRSHPHPVFTPDGRHVVFSSDAGGRCDVYRVSVG
jgi:oligogalacturonide lyase